MPAISFQREFLDALLRGDKQQTTRRQTDRIKVGDVCNIYIEQRNRISDKPLRNMTRPGGRIMYERRYPLVPTYHGDMYHAHFLGKAMITEVYEFIPMDTPEMELKTWAQADGFKDMWDASDWFTARYDNNWVYGTWTVIRWDGWLERYFIPKP